MICSIISTFLESRQEKAQFFKELLTEILDMDKTWYKHGCLYLIAKQA
jgi:hypothetical protein